MQRSKIGWRSDVHEPVCQVIGPKNKLAPIAKRGVDGGHKTKLARSAALDYGNT